MNKKILIFKVGAIGDVLMTTPFVRELRKLYLNSQIDYCVGKWSSDILKSNPNINSILQFDDDIVFKTKIMGLIKLRQKIKKNRYDICYILDRSILAKLFVYSCRIPILIGFNHGKSNLILRKSIGPIEGNHHVKEYLRLINSADIPNTEMEIFPTKDEFYRAREIVKSVKEKNLIGISMFGAKNPGQNMPERRWPIDNYIKLIQKLSFSHKNKILLFGGENDIPEFDIVKKYIPDNVINLIGKITLR